MVIIRLMELDEKVVHVPALFDVRIGKHGLPSRMTSIEAFEQIAVCLDCLRNQGKVPLVYIKGHLGLSQRWSSVNAHPLAVARSLWRAWCTQAVQAEAAMTRQKLREPKWEYAPCRVKDCRCGKRSGII